MGRKGKQSLMGGVSSLNLTASGARENFLARKSLMGIRNKFKHDNESDESFGENETPATLGSTKTIRFEDEDEGKKEHHEMFQRNDVVEPSTLTQRGSSKLEGMESEV